jgi:hypothetical protein
VVDVVPVLSGDDDRSARLRPRKRFNLQARLGGERLLKGRVALWADVFNLFDWGKIPAPPDVFAAYYRTQERRSVRLGLECRY